MKKLTALLLVVALCFAFSACKHSAYDPSGKMTGICFVYVVNGENKAKYDVTLSEIEVTEGAYSVLKYLAEQNLWDMEVSGSGEWAFLNSYGPLVPGDRQYIAMYTTVAADWSLPPYNAELTLDNKTFGYSGVGMTGMTVEAGASILLLMDSY